MIKKYGAILFAVVSLLVSSFVGYSHERESTNRQVAILDTRQQDDRGRLERFEDRLNRIEQKLDAILRKMKDW